MCGISVIIDPEKKQIQEADIKRLNNLIKHRGPDGEGYYYGNHFALGHRALNITDFSLEGHQPMSYMDYVIIHNGEIYNFRELKERLQQKGYKFKSKSDTEVVMAAYDCWGAACVENFSGMWAFVLYDKKNHTLFCSRDRYGIKPMFYSQVDKKLVIGSEIKQLTAMEGFVPSINPGAAFDYLFHAKISGTQDSFFEGVQHLPGGHNLFYDLRTHQYSVEQWYDVNKVKQNKPGSLHEAADGFRDLFTNSILEYTSTKLQVGACLSGGLDSTAIVGMAKKINRKIVSFSSCYTQQGYNEIEYVNDAVQEYGFENFKSYPDISQLLADELLEKIVYHQDQPILSGSFFSEYKVFESAAAQEIRIMLSGQGADEYLAGYREFSQLYLLQLFKGGKLARFGTALKSIAEKQEIPVSAMLRSLVVFSASLERFNKQVDEAHRSEILGCLQPEWLKKMGAETMVKPKFNDVKSVNELSRKALVDYSLPHQLHSEDRNSMLFSIESRLPFLDHRLVEYCLSMPDNYLIRNGATKAILRESLKSILPKSIYNRHLKLAFPGPEEALFRNNYHQVMARLKKCLHDFPEIFTPQIIKVYQDYYNGRLPYSNILFRIISFGAWASQFGLTDATHAARKSVLSVDKAFSKL